MTTSTATEFESTEGMSDACREGLRNLLIACADTKLLLGYHYGEWTFGPPELEAAIACCSLSQSELGHVRLLHAVLRNQFGDDADALVEQRRGTEFASVSFLDDDIADWAGFVAANYVVDLAVTRLLHAMRDSTFAPLRVNVEKMLDEERYHAHHGQGWFRTLCGKNDECRAAAQRSLHEAVRSVAQWFGPAGDAQDEAMVAAGVKAKTNPEILQDLLSDLSETARTLGVELEAESPALDGWNPATRRVGPGGPAEEILHHLRGSKNAIFKLN
jgi:phenylacetate-CoA oxygenase PaaI subunit